MAAFWFTEVYGSYALPALAIWDMSKGVPGIGTPCNNPIAQQDDDDLLRLFVRVHGQGPGKPAFVDFTRA